jgi:hypothetical protein
MKNIVYKTLAILIVSITLVNSTKAQNVTFKTNAFDNYANEIVCNVNGLNELFTKSAGETIQINLGNNFTVVGTVKSSVQKYVNLKTMIVALTNFPNMIFSISKLSDSYTAEKYVGRIIGSTYNDLYELMLINGEYKLQKQQYANVVMSCPQ